MSTPIYPTTIEFLELFMVNVNKLMHVGDKTGYTLLTPQQLYLLNAIIAMTRSSENNPEMLEFCRDVLELYEHKVDLYIRDVIPQIVDTVGLSMDELRTQTNWVEYCSRI